jgi:hypothetical protein
MLIKLFYVSPDVELKIEQRKSQGEGIGIAQDRAAYAKAKDPTRGPMTNHVHLSLYTRSAPHLPWILTDPTPYFQELR